MTVPSDIVNISMSRCILSPTDEAATAEEPMPLRTLAITMTPSETIDTCRPIGTPIFREAPTSGHMLRKCLLSGRSSGYFLPV